MQLPGALLSPSLKNKENQLWKNFLYFLKKNIFHISRKWNSYISGNGTFKPKLEKIKKSAQKKFIIFPEMPHIFLIFQQVTFRARKIKKPALKKCLIFREMELYSLKLKKLLIFQNIRSQKSNQKIFYISFYIFCFLRENFLNIGAKEKSFLHFPLSKSKMF